MTEAETFARVFRAAADAADPYAFESSHFPGGYAGPIPVGPNADFDKLMSRVFGASRAFTRRSPRPRGRSSPGSRGI